MALFRIALVNADNWDNNNPAVVVSIPAKNATAAMASVMDSADMVMLEADYLEMLQSL